MARGKIKPKIKKAKKGQQRLKGISGIAIQPTEQEIKIAEGLAKGLSKKDALMQAGIAESNARSNSAELTNTPGVNKAMQDALSRAQVGVDRIAQTIKEGLEATKVVSTKPWIIFPDFSERRQTARFASDLLGLLSRDGVPSNSLTPGEEKNLISQAEQEAGMRDVSRYLNRE